MAYLVLACGAILSVWGAVSMYFGYGIVEVERGWTGVIAGATCLAGGMIVMALALVIKSLSDVRGTLSTLSLPPGIRTEPAAVRSETAQYSLDFETQPVAGEASTPSPAVTGDLQSGMLATIMAPLEPRHDDSAVSFEQQHEPVSTPVADPAPPRPSLFEIKAPEASYAKPRQRVTMKPQPAPPRKEEPPPAPDPEPRQDAVPSMDDWLDRAFSALDHEVATSPAQTIVPPHHQEPDHHQPTQGHGDLAHRDAGLETREQLVHDHERAEAPADHGDALHAAHPELAADHPPPVQDPEPAPVAPAAPLVLEPVETGRYETDGTTYIMYSDGSIDVQSEAGTYRFASMAELKAYIEGTA